MRTNSIVGGTLNPIPSILVFTPTTTPKSPTASTESNSSLTVESVSMITGGLDPTSYPNPPLSTVILVTIPLETDVFAVALFTIGSA